MKKQMKSFNSFSDRLQRQEPDHIAIQPSRHPKRGFMSVSYLGSLGLTGDYEHGLNYNVTIGKKHKVYVETLFTSFQSEYGLSDILERNLNAMSVILAGEIRVAQLSVLLPESEILLAGPNLQPFKEGDLILLHQQAERFGVEPAEFIC